MKYKYLLILLILLFSCKKETIIKRPPLSLTIVSDHILQKTNSPFYLGVSSYIQKGVYDGEENLSLTVDGIPARLVKSQLVKENFTALFQVSGISTTGEHKVICKYSIGSSSSTQEQTIRIVKDFSLASIWDKLDQTYASQYRLIYVYPSNGFTYEPLARVNLSSSHYTGTALSLGEYRTNFASFSSLYVSKPFIAALDGRYTAYYENNLLKEIWVEIADTYTDPFFSFNELMAQLTNQYGTLVTDSGKYIFRSGAFDIEINYYRYVQAVIKKVR